ncbi:hypothetical protein ACX0G9_17615 [Flavitalea flava]
MRDIVLLISLGLLSTIFMACKKDKHAENQGLVGSWEIRSVEGGYSPTRGGTYAPGNGYVLQFTDSKYYHYINGQAQDSGTYKIEKELTNPFGPKKSKLTYITDHSRAVYFQATGDTLTIYDGIISADGTISKYVPVSK